MGRGTILGIISEGGEDPIHIPEHCQGSYSAPVQHEDQKKLLGDFLGGQRGRSQDDRYYLAVEGRRLHVRTYATIRL